MSFDPFESLTGAQREQLRDYQKMLLRFNQRVNLISPDTEGDVRTRHLLHGLSLTVRGFPAGSTIVDWGTGGGLPAIPLAIVHPEVTVVAVDSVGKKVRAVRTMARRLGLENCFPWKGRAEAWDGSAHYSVSRATAPLADLWRWHTRIAESDGPLIGDDHWRPGLLCLKGGDLSDEIAELRAEDPDVHIEQHALRPMLGDPYFAEKVLVEVHR
jgi:16S rRNA (guanine527-N7)-methyltransferase